MVDTFVFDSSNEYVMANHLGRVLKPFCGDDFFLLLLQN